MSIIITNYHLFFVVGCVRICASCTEGVVIIKLSCIEILMQKFVYSAFRSNRRILQALSFRR